ncbi:hypothetical protein ACE1TI_11845 [Alteribacillus sp. JSM 102045]|uniref:hypothetical protein n=1 Tax=Alteribacillus sp. JSM 102045 TaxID=1562101 RepID=UPI0035C1445D
MLNKKRNKIFAGAVILLALLIVLGDRLMPVLTLLLAGLSFYAGTKLLKKEQSRMMVGAGLGLILAGSFILTGWLQFFIGITCAGFVLYMAWKQVKRKKADSTVISSSN